MPCTATNCATTLQTAMARPATDHRTNTRTVVARRKHKSSPRNKETEELTKLLTLLNIPSGRHQFSSVEKDGATGPSGGSLQWPTPQPKNDDQQHESTEALALERFSLAYQTERNFSEQTHEKCFTEIFTALVKNRFSSSNWIQMAPPENILRVVMCLRILMRDEAYQKRFSDLDGINVLAGHLEKLTDSYMAFGDGPFVVDILKEMTNIFQKLSSFVQQRQCIVACGATKSLVLLLNASDVIVLHCSLHALSSLAHSAEPRNHVIELNAIEMLLQILQDYDTLSKKLAATLLRLLCANPRATEMIKAYDGIALLLSLLHNDNVKLLWNIVWCLVQLSSDPEASNDIRQMGGIPLILSLLHERSFESDRSSSSDLSSMDPMTPLEEEFGMWNRESSAFSFKEPLSGKQAEELKEHQFSLKSACCACLTELVLNDTNAHQVAQANGIYLLMLLIPPSSDTRGLTDRQTKALHTLQANAFRTLRFLFSMERNRKLFKRLFPPTLFEMFIDIGHYRKDIAAYRPLVDKLHTLSADTMDEIIESIDAIDQNKPPSHYIGDYAVLDLLGSGAFGSVYRVKKKTSGESYLAMKEINTMNPTWGKTSKERQKSVGAVISELTIIREQMRHPNVVRYYKTFVEQEKLYIVMELIEGVPLGEHFTFLKEKGERFSEDRVWNVFIQIVLALRYLHKEKGIVHRDLTPNNIMLGENNKVTITDFGLAKQKQKDSSQMTSVVGTILYSCPEIVQSQPYGEKSDIWAVGCILYQICTLTPPFYSNNMLSLATKIVEAEYKPIPEGEYSEKVISTIRRCITADPEMRPDIVGLAAHISDVLLVYMDSARRQHISTEKRLERERRRTQRNFYEAHQNMQDYHRLFLVSQERYDKLVNLASSGGGSSIKDDADLTEVFTDATRGSVSAMPEVGGSTWRLEDEMCSSGSESRGSSAGVTERQDPHVAMVPRPPAASRTWKKVAPSGERLVQQLSLDLPVKCSRDSGIGSRDVSPNHSCTEGALADPSRSVLSDQSRLKSTVSVQRSSSTPSLDGVRRVTSAGKIRPSSATTAMLTISPRKVRQISDPILQMLHQLHKIIYITQLPPTLCHNPRRRVLERFKRALFAAQSTSFNLKNEMQKLLTGSREIIDLNFGPSESPKLARQVNEEYEANSNIPGLGVYDTEAGDVGITYEQMQSIIESVLVESGYYDMSRNHSRIVPPFTPGGATVNDLPNVART